MKRDEILAVTLNVGILSVFYTAIGAFLSYIIYQFFDSHTPEWEKKSTAFKTFDVVVELALIGIVAFWLTFNIKEARPIFPIRKELDELVDIYISGVFFIFAIFIFLDDLSSKLKHLYDVIVERRIKKYIPEDGSILDASLRWRKTD
jgi:magnesium-transporting ATPase (P-type)